MRRLVWIALSAAAACSEVSKVNPGSTDSFYQPTGLGVYAGKLVVASSNSDLRFDGATGGSVISVDPAVDRGGERAGLVSGLNIESFAGEMAIADPASCPGMASPEAGAVAVVPVRGENRLYVLRVGAGGALSCDGCSLDVGGREHVDPFSAGVACGNGIARAYVSHLRSSTGAAWITQVDLTKPITEPGAVQSGTYGLGNVRGFAYDADLQRMYMAVTGNGVGAGVRWLDLAGGCTLGVGTDAGGCTSGAASIPPGLEAFGIALSSPELTSTFPRRRAYVATRLADPSLTGSSNSDGFLLVADLVDDAQGNTRLQIVSQIPIGSGAGNVAVLPRVASRAGMRDVVAVLAAGDGVWLFDDETGARVRIGRDPATGHPLVGRSPGGIAVDPVPQGSVARLYVGSFEESYVTRIDVPLDDIGSLQPDAFRRIRGGTP